ncbi:solute carrier family 2, facilitated glucose transporter member 1-like isoform X3 [Aphidius gifuensis]|uniref:solute carrier family 2, facilitated glucose transporter member 1-like isoform X3 n=1 Tax=Aphidius gifuensis TaxID=684658 RepID=UPI001CDBCA9E|nr:solute carrier family 2, facilitated glucose transporter member 1-like isoform X3 [Aphidius gifuensis]XP_044002557.1 solute carrier family 2, facilitated glucose transporter member 1-like isoform X3 [Aphidius gifuensis]
MEISKSKEEIQDQPSTPTALAPSSKGLNSHLLFAIIAGALGSAFQHGYNTGVVNSPQVIIEQWIGDLKANESNATYDKDTSPPELKNYVTMVWSIVVAIFCLGGMIGGSLVGTFADKFGRKGSLLVVNILVALAAILEGFARTWGSWHMLVVGRLIIGINSGLNAGLAPMYLAEISPTHLRGAIGTVYQLIITISILVAQIISMNSLLGTVNTWPLLLALTLVPAIFQCITLPICPESPKYLLLSKGKDVDAQKALQWLRSTSDVYEEMEDMRSEYESVKHIPKVTLREMLVNPALRIPIIIAVMVMLAQQLSGINAVMFFSTKIFSMAKLNQGQAELATIGVGVVNVLMTLVSLLLVEKFGRKTLLLFGFGGMVIDTALLTLALTFADSSPIIAIFAIIFVIMFVVLFATGPGSIPWFLVSELFNQSARPVATSISIAINWAANFIVSIAFLPLQQLMNTNVFIIFVILQAGFTLFIYKKVPETKNKTIEEISSLFRQRSYQ